MKFNGIILAAHRGDRKNYPENTMPAFEAALEKNMDMIETDIHLTRDGELIIMHDDNAVRTTGVDRFLCDMTLEEVMQLDAGALFSEKFKGTKVPTVEEFIALIKNTDIMINWELKDYPKDWGDEHAFRAADKLIEAIEKHGLEERSMLNSFSDRVLEHVYKERGHKYPIHGQGINSCPMTVDKAEMPEEELFDWCCMYSEERGKSPLDFEHNFAYCNEHGIYPCICIGDTVKNYEKAIKLGCRMFTSNDIDAAEEILKQLNVR